MLDILDRGLSWLERILYVGAALSLVAMMLSITADAMGRFLFGTPVAGVYEVNEMYLLPAIVYLSIARAQSLNEHIAVDVFVGGMRPALQRLLLGLGRLLAIGLFAAIAYRTGEMAHRQFVMGNITSGAILLPAWIGWFVVSVGCVAMTMRLTLQVLFDIVGRRPADKPHLS